MIKPLLLLSVLVTPACTPHAGTSNLQASDEQEVTRIEQEVVSATNQNDAASLERLLAPDFTFVNPAGILLDRSEFLGGLRTGKLHLDSYTVDSMQVRLYGPAATVIYRSSVVGTAFGADITSHRRRTMMLVKRDGQWVVVAQQSTPILSIPR